MCVCIYIFFITYKRVINGHTYLHENKQRVAAALYLYIEWQNWWLRMRQLTCFMHTHMHMLLLLLLACYLRLNNKLQFISAIVYPENLTPMIMQTCFCSYDTNLFFKLHFWFVIRI